MKYMKAIGIAVCGLAMLAGAVFANEQIEDSWYGDGGANSPYALKTRDTRGDNSYNYTPSPEQWRDRNIYQLFTDRFASDGNNLVRGYRPRWDCEYSGDGLNRSYPFNRNYHHGGNWNGMRQQIPYLKGMGVTAVWISGVQQNDQGVNDQRWTPYHQYHVDNFFRCDPCMGTFEDLTKLIDELHANGIAVILDVAPNHMCDKNGWGSVQEDKGFHWDENGQHWWYEDNKHCAPFDDINRFHVNGTINNWDQSPENLMGQFKGTDDLDQDDPQTSDYLYRAFKNLIDATDCDGFRVDAIKHIPYDWCRNWAQAIRNHAAWRGKSNFLMFGELFSYDTGALASWCRDGYGFNSALLFPLMQAMNNVFGSGYSSYELGEKMNQIQQYGDGKENVIAFLDNHDVNRFAQAFAGNDTGYAKWIMSPALTFLYLAPPVPLLYYGTEHMFNQGGHGNGASRNGDEYSDQYNPDDSDWQRECMFNRGFQPGAAAGDKFSDAAKNSGLYYHVAWLNGLRNKSRALRRGGFEQRYYSGGQGLYAFTKWFDNETALVVVNTSDSTQSAGIYSGRPSTHFTVFNSNGTTGETDSGGDGNIWVELEGKGSRVYICNFQDNSADLGSTGGSSGGGSELWAANTYGYPRENATTADTLWVNTEAGPSQVAADGSKNFKVMLVYGINTDDPDEWTATEMTLNEGWDSANGGWYHANLGNLPVGKVEYLVAVDADGMETYWDHNPETGGNFVLHISAAPNIYFQNVSATPTEPDDGGSVKITAKIASGLDTDVSGLTASLTYAFSYKGTAGDWSTPAAMAKVAGVYTNETDTTTNLWTTFEFTIDNLQGGKTLLYKVSASNNGETIQANGGNAYEVPISGTVAGLVGNCWHCPTNREPYEEYCMRTPVTPKEGWTMWLRMGNYQPEANMTDGKLWYRFGAGTNASDWTEWASADLVQEQDGDSRFFYGNCDIPVGQEGNYLQYFFEAHYSDAEYATTYLYMHPDNSAMYMRTTNVKEARETPFEVGIAPRAPSDEPGFIWHGGNITRLENNKVQVWAKIGYQPDDAPAWADEAVIRYRIDLKEEGTKRSRGVRAIKSKTARATRSWKALTNEVSMKMQSLVADAAGNGQAMMWMGTITDDRLLDPNAVMIYEIYAKNSKGNDNWKQAEYNAGDGSCTFEYRMWSDGSGDLMIFADPDDTEGVPADYTTTKVFIDEAAGDTVKITVKYHAPDGSIAELFTNFGRRDYADTDSNGDGWPDGMIPPDGNDVTVDNCSTSYWQAVRMDPGPGAYEKTLETGKCGVYRITARWKAKEGDDWTWYSENPEGAARRDHVVVISPKKAMQQTMYELNVLTTKATGTNSASAGNFEQLSERLVPGGDDPYGEFSIDYLNRMGVNCLWFQPIHPNLNYSRGNTNDAGTRYNPGSPYATKNYFSVSAEMSASKTEAAAEAAFTNFVRLCDKAQSDAGGVKNLSTINVMLDGVMNHTSFDAVFGEGYALATNGLGADAIAELDAAAPGWKSVKATDIIPSTSIGLQWYSHVVDDGHDQSYPATRYVSVDDNDIANAPERYDFGKWNDVAELLYGDYSTMVKYDDRIWHEETYWAEDEWGNWSLVTNRWADLGEETSRIYSEEDQYYYGSMRPATKLLWKYMASYPEYWIKKTGHGNANTWDAADDLGIDGLRCDYAQGLPNQFWEYCINRTRALKWNFLFMAESLDGGKVGFRSNRQFDILNENMVFRFTQDHVSDPVTFQTELENRRQAYGNGLILLNETCHDEIMPWGDPQATASRYAMVSAIDGVPMIFFGQEQAISTFVRYYDRESHSWKGENGGEPDDPDNANKWKGFSKFESNFGKWIPHFKTWNKMLVWNEKIGSTVSTNMVYSNATPNASRDMAAFYGRINLARQKSPALQSQNRWFLNDTNKVMFVAKWEEAGANPNDKDAVFAAVLFLNDNMDGDHNGHWGADCTYQIAPFAANMGIENRADRYYNLVNIASTDTNWFWDTPKTGKELYEKGLKLEFQGSWEWDEENQRTNELPCSVWSDNGNVVKYLKVYDVTGELPPVAPEGLTINDPTAIAEVAHGTASYAVEGMAGADIDETENVVWVNALTGTTNSFAPSTVWTQSVALATGTNVITFTAKTKSGGGYAVVASEDGDGPVAGFGDFTATSGAYGSYGLFVRTAPVSDLGITGFTGDKAFGLWADPSGYAEYTRAINAAGEVQSASVTVGMNWSNDDNNDANDKGVQFLDAEGGIIFGIAHGSNSVVKYYGAGGDGTWSETLNSCSAFDITLTKTSNGYAVSGTKRDGGEFPGLNITTTAKVAAFKFFMHEAMSDNKDKRQLYFDNLRYTVSGGEAGTATATATIVVTGEAKDAPVITVGTIPENVQIGTKASFTVTATGNGNPTISVQSAKFGTKTYGDYSFLDGQLSFTPAAEGVYSFVFQAKNTLDNQTSNRTVSVTAVNNTVELRVTGVPTASIVNGKLNVTLAGEFGTLTTVPVWLSNGLKEGKDGKWDWDWYSYGTAPVVSNQVSLDNLGFTTDSLMISIGKPNYDFE